MRGTICRPLVLALAMLAALAWPGPAAAAESTLALSLNGDGAGGVTVLAVYQADGRPFEQRLELTLTATGEDGRVIGPLPLEPGTEGRGFYVAADILAPGTWKVVVTADQPQALRAEAIVLARPPATVALPEDQATSAGPPESKAWLLLALPGILGALALGGLLLHRRRQARV